MLLHLDSVSVCKGRKDYWGLTREKKGREGGGVDLLLLVEGNEDVMDEKA